MNRKYKYDYTLHPNADSSIYERAVATLANKFSQFISKEELEDVDGSQIKVFANEDKEIVVYNDYDTDAVYIKSDIDLSGLYGGLETY